MPQAPFNFQPEEKKKKHTPSSLLHAIKTTRSILEPAVQGRHQESLAKAIYSGVKMASPLEPQGVFFDRLVNPIKLAESCRDRWGLQWLGWSPETLCSMIDREAGLWTAERAGEALDHFQTTGEMDTEVPSLVRQKLYALRVVIVTDSAQHDWAVFEKVGSAFNDRVADFATLQKMSPAECARTIAIIESLRPEPYGEQIHAYVGASCAEDGLLTVKPVKWLAWVDEDLQKFNREVGVAPPAADLTEKLTTRMQELKQATSEPNLEDPITAQALKLLAIQAYADEVVES